MMKNFYRMGFTGRIGREESVQLRLVGIGTVQDRDEDAKEESLRVKS